MADVMWLTYDELSERLSITRESARQLVIRKRWGRRKGNDAKTRVAVPEEVLQSRTSDDAPRATPSEASNETAYGPSDVTGHDTVVPILTRHIERIEKELQGLTAKLATVETERDIERQRVSELAVEAATAGALRLTVDALKTALEADKQRLVELRQERDRWYQTATAPRGLFRWLRRG